MNDVVRRTNIYQCPLTHMSEDDMVERLEDMKMLLSKFSGSHRHYPRFATDVEEAIDDLIDHLNHQTDYFD